MTNTEQLSDP